MRGGRNLFKMRALKGVFFATLCILLAACSGGGGGETNSSAPPATNNTANNPPTFSVGGSISGLSGTVVLQNNGGDSLAIQVNGPFGFQTPLASGASYRVTVLTQPAGQHCLVSGDTGTITTGSVTSVGVTCSALAGPPASPSSFFVGGTVQGLAGSLTLENNGGDGLLISTIVPNSRFAFVTPLPDGASYQVTVRSQPANQQCTVNAGSGVIAGADVRNVSVTCRDMYTVGGTASGLVGTVVLGNNGGDSLPLSADGSFTFATPLVNGAAYQVTVLTQPAMQQCTVSAGGGVIASANVANVRVSCESFYTVGGTTSGLTGTVVLQNKGGDDLTVSGGTSFTFATTLFAGATYEVTLLAQPAGQRCMVLKGAGTIAAADVTGVRVACNTLRASKYLYLVSTGFLNNPMPQSPTATLAQFTIGADGALAPMTPVTVSTGSGASSVTVDRSGKFAYVTNRNGDTVNGTVWQYTIGTDGGLVPMNPATVEAGINPFRAAVDPNGRYVYVINRGAGGAGGSISQYAIAADGQLVPLTPAAVAGGDTSIAVDPSGRYVYATIGALVLQYTIASDGTLTPMTPASLDSGLLFLQAITADPFGRMVYATETLFSRVPQFAIGDSGALTFKGDDFTSTLSALSFTIDPTGMFAYAGSGATIARYSVNADGTLELLPNPVFADSVGCIAADLSAKYVYACSGDPQNKLLQYTIGSDGALVPMTPPSLDVGIGPSSIAISP